MGLFRRSSSSTSDTPVRRPVLDPDSDAVVWATDAERADDQVLNRMLAEARDQHR